MKYTCSECGHVETLVVGIPCSRCGRDRCVVELEPINAIAEFQPLGVILDGNPDDPAGRQVQSRPPEGGAADSTVLADGSFEVKLAGKLDVGRASESRVIRVFSAKLRELGHDVTVDTGARDDYGEDGVILIDERRWVLQVVTVPSDPEFWKRLRIAGAASVAGDLTDSIELLRRAIVAKAKKAQATVLLLDLSHISAVSSRALRDAYIERYGNPTQEYSFQGVWLVGPTTRSTIRLDR